MRILVTGGAGFIGSFLVDSFLAEGHKVRILDNLDKQVHPQGFDTASPTQPKGQPSYLPTTAELLVADARDRDAMFSALDDVDVVVHCAAAVGIGQSLYRIKHYVDANVGGTANLLEAIVERKQPLRKLIVFGSMSSYGEGLYRRPSDGQLLRPRIRTEEDIRRFGWEPVCPDTREPLEPVAISEDAALLAQNVYALTKRYQEELALSIGKTYDFPVVCLRLFNVYGPRQSLSNPYTGVLAIFLSRLLAGQSPVVYEDGGQTRDFVSVHDVMQAVMLTLRTSAADGQVVNIGSGVPRSIGGIARTLASLVGREDLQPNITGEYRKGDVRHGYADITKARDLLGFEPRVCWEDGLTELIEWTRAATKSDGFAQADKELRERGLVS